MTKVKTTQIGGGANYAKVSERLKAFRSENPRASIETTPLPQEGGMMMFKARILRDKSDEFSAEATGHALQTKTGIKDFEKLETIAVGRALALLGYAADGEIASSDEMEEFLRYQEEKQEVFISEMRERLTECKSLDELKKSWQEIPAEAKKELETLKEEIKKKYENI